VKGKISRCAGQGKERGVVRRGGRNRKIRRCGLGRKYDAAVEIL
jgi:hypothetical protein